MKRVLFVTLFFLSSTFLLVDKAYADIDLRLEDDKENSKVSIVVNSNNGYVDGLDFTVIGSDDVVIGDITKTEEYCLFGNSVVMYGNKVMVECFNDLDVVMDGILASFNYTSQSDDYYFYFDNTLLDVGNLIIGEVANINAPEEIDYSNTLDTYFVEEEVTTTFFEDVLDFLRENSLFVLLGVLTVIASITLIIGFSSKKY